MIRHLVAAAIVALVAVPSELAAQQPRGHVGGAVSLNTQTQSATDRLGGTTWSGSVVFGAQVAPRLAIEFEPSFGGAFSREYSYPFAPSLIADVVASRRDTFFSFQVRSRVGVVEPVIGASYVRGSTSRHATTNGRPYFDDQGSDNGVAIVGGLDAAIKLAPRFFFVPTFRVFVASRPEPVDAFDPLRDDTKTGAVVFRYGAGARVIF